MAFEAEPGRGQRQHAAELAAAEDADRGVGGENRLRRIGRMVHAPSFGMSLGTSATAAVCLARQATSRSSNA